MLDQLIIGNKSSLDFDASVAGRKIGKPKKKEIRETIPFSNITYDFSKTNGELYWNDREISYNLEVIADSPKELEEKKRLLSAWLMNVVEEKIFDPYIADFHFLGTYSDMDFEDDESMLKTTATVIFTAYPYMIANNKKVYRQSLPAGGGSDTLTWDGDTTGLVSLDLGEGIVLYKISDNVPSLADAQRGGFTKYAAEEDLQYSSDGVIVANDTVYCIVNVSVVLVVLEDNADLFGMIVPEKGVYFATLNGTTYIESLTINGYTGFPSQGGSATITVVNNSSHRIRPTITADADCTFTLNDATFSISAGTYEGDSLFIKEGDNTLLVSNSSADKVCTFEIGFFEEVF